MHQWFTVARIAGKGAQETSRLFTRWNEKGRPDSEDSDLCVWPAACQREMRRFVTALRRHGAHPPVTFYRRYVDMWSMGDLLHALQAAPAKSIVEVAWDGGQAICCDPAGFPAVKAQVLREAKSAARRKSAGDQESLWFFQALLDAFVFGWPEEPSVILVVREVLGGLVEDSELEASFRKTPAWLRGFNRQPPA